MQTDKVNKTDKAAADNKFVNKQIVYRSKKYKAVYRVAYWILYFIYWCFTRAKYSGLENIPKSAPMILICNHIRNSDAPASVFALGRRGRYARVFAKDSLWKIPILKQFFNFLKLIPVHRKSSAAADSLDIAAEELAKGEAIVILPEGTTSKRANSPLLPFKTGAARLALKCPYALLVPAAQDFINNRLVYKIGEPIEFSESDSVAALTEKMREAVDKILKEIRSGK
ncbi:MAG: 1-acyl-sn-glycerol-3-phosphate acyltransferase [Bifidobacteriaceae bacterium]|jgi:1-acyl-sn-glycerol-3-phosphate acyltransferase|nr:1-acyl-sn-glycerol-3-phosphate acyltransferase [Bifidobacteriaceae bacterium]